MTVFEEFANSDCATMVSHRPRHKFIKIYEKKLGQDVKH